jgi:hypothetical protein
MATNPNNQLNNFFYPSYEKINKSIYYLIWGLAYFSMTSCLIRNDYNIIFSFLMLFIFSNLSNENKKYYSKVLIHLLIGLSIADILWLIFIIPTNKNYKKSINISYLESLDSMNYLCFYLGIFEILFKLVILSLILYDYRCFFPNQLNFLMNFDYKIPEISNDDGLISNLIKFNKLNKLNIIYFH